MRMRAMRLHLIGLALLAGSAVAAEDNANRLVEEVLVVEDAVEVKAEPVKPKAKQVVATSDEVVNDLAERLNQALAQRD